MSKPDIFGFEAATAQDAPDLDIAAFEPAARQVDRPAVEAARAAARDSGFTRRSVPSREPQPESPAPARSRKRRVNITELLGIQDRYPDTERAQLNMLAPVPIALRWRAVVQARQIPAWEVLEAAMDALEAQGAYVPSKHRRDAA